MSEIDLTYRQLLHERERKRLQGFMDSPDPEDLQEPAGTTPVKAKEPTQGVLSKTITAGATRAGEFGKQGVVHFMNGINRVAQSTSDRDSSGIEALYGFGEVVLGGMTLAFALPAGIGASFRTAVTNFVPGLDKSVMLSGGRDGAAGPLRFGFGVPAFLLDPEIHKIIRGDPKLSPEERIRAREEFMKELQKDMTYGEGLELLAGIAIPGLFLKTIRGRRQVAAETPEPLIVQETAGLKATAETPGKVIPRMTPDEMAVRAQALIDEMEGRVAPKAAPEAPAPKVPEGPLPTVAEVAEARATHLQKLETSLEVATRRAQEIILDEVSRDPELSKIIIDAKKLQERRTPTIEEAAGEPPAVPVGQPKTPAELAEGTKVPKVERSKIIEQVEREMPDATAAAKEAEVNRRMAVPEEEPVIVPRKPTEGAAAEGEVAPRPVEPLARGRGKRPKLPQLPQIPEPPAGQRGSVPADLIARMAVGAVIGGAFGDTPEDRVKFALLGMLGGAIAPRVARRFVKTVEAEAPGLLDPSMPRVPAFSKADVTETTNLVIDRVAGPNKDLARRILSLEETDVLTLEELRLGKQIEMRTWEEVRKLGDDLAEGRPTKPGEIKEALALARILNDQIKHTGRRMGATGGRGMERVKVSVSRVNKLAREWDPSTSDLDIAIAVRTLGTIDKVSNFTRLNFAIPEAFTQAMYGSMLLGKALTKNAIGSLVMLPVSIMDRSFASLRFLDPNRTVGVARQGFIAMSEGLLDQLRMIRRWDELGEQARAMGATHVEVLPRGFEAIADIFGETGHPMMAKGFDFLNSAANLAPDIMARTDGATKNIHGRMAIVWEAQEKALAEGLRGEPFANRVRELIDNYDQLGPDALLRVKEHRDNMTFTRQLESDILQALQIGPADPWANLGYRMFVLPFVRTPVRLYDVGAAYTPGLNLLSATFRREMRASPSRRATAEGRLATGTLVIGGFMSLAMQGLITGSMPSNPDEVKALTAAGRPPQSFWDPLAQKMRSYRGIEPLTQWISTGADLAIMIQQMDEVKFDRLLTAASLAISNNINVTQFMQAVSEFIDVAKTGRTDSQWEQSLEFIRRRLTVFVPAAAKELVGGEERTRVMLTREFDEDKSPNAAIHREFQALKDSFKQGFGAAPGDPGKPPFIKRLRNMFTGEVLLNDVFPFNPFTTTPIQPAPWAREIIRLNGAGIKQLDEWLGRPQPADIGLQPRQTAPGVRLLPNELDRLEVLMTQEVKIGGRKLTESLDDLVTNPRYERQSDFTKEDSIQERWHAFRELAERRLMLENKEVRDKFRARRGESIIEMLPPVRQPGARERLKQRLGPGVAP